MTFPSSPELISRLAAALLPIDRWGTFRRGARPAAVVALLFRREGRWHVPFVVRQSGLRNHPGQIGLPGGGLLPDENAWTAAAREANEEIGVNTDDLVPLGAAPPVYAAVSNYSVVPFVAWLRGPEPTFVPDSDEVAAVLEVPLSTLIDENAWIGAADSWPGLHLPVVDTAIWGLTARLLADLLPALRAGRREAEPSGEGSGNQSADEPR
ncbi:MAG: NUDIX hydrolase [Candidatus Dormibacter sp.]|uniref:NUDIX hydrolase n=1 Tax=Candidatus Dormibacter sp. TaxID=2973982 RepID=UPI003D9BE710